MGRVGAAASEHGTERWWVGWGGNKGRTLPQAYVLLFGVSRRSRREPYFSLERCFWFVVKVKNRTMSIVP